MEHVVIALYIFIALLMVVLVGGGVAIYHFGERPKLRALARAQAGFAISGAPVKTR